MPYAPGKLVQMTQELILAAQKAWGDGIVKIAKVHNDGDFVQAATDHINTLYAYGLSPVLFKPTLAAEEQFRDTFDKALSYFVASNNACPEDKGFAIKGWTAVRFDGEIITIGSVGMAMGNYFFTTPEGDESKVEYSFGYMLDADGNVRINLHHSSMPYAPTPTVMTKEMIEAAQKAWGDGIVHIAKTHTDGGDFVQAATDHINNLYAYGLSDVLFKPTLAAEEQFRPTFDKALSYFVASNNACPEDKGFAIKGWTAVRFDGDIITEGSVGMAMGNYFFTTPEGDEAKVEYSFGYMLDADDNVRIILHHSSMPYAPSSGRLLRGLRGLLSASKSRSLTSSAEMTKA